MSDLLFPADEPARSGRFARVLLETGIDAPEGLTYAIPASMADLVVGERVVAPLGRADRPAEGHVVEIVDHVDLPPARVKPLVSRMGVQTPAALVRLAQWMAAYYCCPVGMVLATMIPAAVKKGTGRIRRRALERTDLTEPATPLTPSARTAWEALQALPEDPFPIEPRALADRLGLSTLGPLNRLRNAGLLRETEIITVRAPLFDVPRETDARPTLTTHQRAAVEAVTARLGTFTPHLLRGVTGSGKTEVYLHVLEAVLARGMAAIVLVPEISLTPQTAGRFLRRFQAVDIREDATGEVRLVAVLHSGLTASQRHQQWMRLASGDARIAIGARSAIFAPFPDRTPLGLIVVDEEHDSSYKQDQLPRYHARDVALKRGQLEECPVLLGSATPSLESWHNARRGRFHLIELTERVAGGVLPRVEVVDLAAERRTRPDLVRSQDTLGPRLADAIGHTLDAGGQVILLLNRRGYAGYIACASSSCGWCLRCDQCDVNLVHHRARPDTPDGHAPAPQLKFVQCHHCLSRQRLPALCPVCGRKLMHLGFGTQRLEEELAARYPQLVDGHTMLRLDGDTMRTARDYFEALEAFRRGDVRLLTGTQMIAKGLDFPDVRLIGVVNADTAIHLPDFRSAERTFQLVSQVAGRAGRSAASADTARVIVQTMNPHEPAIVLAACHDYTTFAERELESRRAAGLPPVTRMARIVCRDEDRAAAEARARTIADALRALHEPGLHIHGPAPCPIARIANHTRIAVELLAPGPAPLQHALTTLRNLDVARSDRHTAIDVDPVALL